jgi:hypothetical protein
MEIIASRVVAREVVPMADSAAPKQKIDPLSQVARRSSPMSRVAATVDALRKVIPFLTGTVVASLILSNATRQCYSKARMRKVI